MIEEIQVVLMVLGTFSLRASLGPSPDISPAPGSSCVLVSGCACAILRLSFLAASRAGVLHGTTELPASTLPPALCSTLGSALPAAARNAVYSSTLLSPLHERWSNLSDRSTILFVFRREGELLIFVFLIFKVEYPVISLGSISHKD